MQASTTWNRINRHVQSLLEQSMMSSTERPAKRARLEADKRRDALAKVQDKYADIDFTRFQKVVAADAAGEATPHRFVLGAPRPTHLWGTDLC